LKEKGNYQSLTSQEGLSMGEALAVQNSCVEMRRRNLDQQFPPTIKEEPLELGRKSDRLI